MLNGLGGIVRGTGRLVGAGFHAIGDCTKKLCGACGGLFHKGHHAMRDAARGLDARGSRMIQPTPAPPPPPLLSEQSVR